MYRKNKPDQLAVAASQNIKEREYWLKKLSGDLVKSYFPYDHQKKVSNDSKKDAVTFRYTGELFSRLMALSNGSDPRLHMILAAGLVVVLHKYTSRSDIIVGVPIYKQEIDAEFINTVLALRNWLKGDMSFKELLLQVRQTIGEAVENQGYPIETLLYKLNMSLTGNDFPLFDTFVLLENIHEKKYIQHINNNMTFIFSRTREYIEGKLEYNSLLYEKPTVARIALHFKNVLDQVLLDVNISIVGIDMLSKEEKKKLLFDFNDTEADFPRGKTIHRLFEEQVERTPDHIAVIGMEHGAWTMEKYLEGTGGLAPMNITYRELNKESNRLAHLLQEKGVKCDTIAAIMVERSPEMIIGIMGILKAGGTYLPLDPESPTNRILLMLADSKAGILLTQTSAVHRHSFTSPMNVPVEIIMLDKPGEPSAAKPTGNPGHLSQSKGLAYVIFTSGSTGKPRGVMIEQCSLVNRLNWMQKKYPLDEHDTLLQKTPFTFDVSLWELFWWAIAGAKLYLLAPKGEGDPQLLVDTIEKNQVTVIHFVPSMLNAFLDYVKNCIDIKRLSSLRQVFASGEALGISQVKLFNELLYNRSGTRITNLYGPTEATVDVSYFDCFAGDMEKIPEIPIGKPIDNIRLYVMSNDKQWQPVGVCGELCIAGHGLARGYLNNPELTKERFEHNEKFLRGESRCFTGAVFSKSAPPGRRRLYKTGDLARWLPDGNIEFLGRMDNQVKIRGFRIELGEIENQLLKHEHIKEVVVTARENRDGGINEGEPGDKYLCAYYVSEEKLTLTVPDLRKHLLKELHEYMIPSYFIPIEKILLIPNGKVDFKALPGPGGKVDTGTVYIPPGSKIEEELLHIWQEVLHVEKIGMDDNLFDLGGNSILLLKLHSRINEKYPSTVNVVDLFNYTTIGKLAEFIEKKGGDDDPKIELPVFILPQAFFYDARGNKSQGGIEETDVLTYCVKGSMHERLKNISRSRGIPLVEILLSIYIYMLAEIGGKEEIALHSMVIEENQLESLSINLTNVETLSELFKLVAKSLNNHENSFLSINRISDFPLSKDKYTILTLFYCKDLLRFNGQLTDVYDIVFETDEQGDYIEFTCEYANRFKKEKIEEMTEMYLKLLDVLPQTVEGER
jgi:fengycin family lipopeptide synthetase D